MHSRKRYKELSEELSRARDPFNVGRKVANNTYAHRNDDGSISVRLHQTDVVTISPNGAIELSTGGWYTMTTRDRIERFSGVKIFSDRGVWYVYYPGKDKVPYFDGIKFGPAGKCLNGVSAATWKKYLKDRAAMQRKIQGYCTGAHNWLTTEPREFPNMGDCWYCSMRTTDGDSLGEKTGDIGHLLDHLDESYYMGSLLYNALEAKGYRYPVMFLGYDQDAGTIGGERYRPEHRMGGSVARIALRDYLYDRLLPQPPNRKPDTDNRPLRNNKGVSVHSDGL